MMASSFGYSEPLVSADILRKKCVRLVRDVNVDSVLPVLEPFLLYTEIDAIKAQNNRGGKTRVLIDCLYRRTGAKSYEAFNAFMKILGGTQPELFTEIVGRCPTQSETDFCVEGLSNKLKRVILATGHSTDSPLDEQIDLDKEHISLQITKIQDNVARFKRTDTEELYSQNCNESLPHEYQRHVCEVEKSGENIPAKEILGAWGEVSKSVLLSGRAGVGKSTTLQWLARQWALNEWATGFRILFLIQLRMLSCIDGGMTALDFLTLYGLFRLTTESTQDVLRSWMNNAKARVLIFIDGLDEILGFLNKFRYAPKITDLYQKAHPIDICINILRGDLLPGCTVVCTSRPFAGLACLNTYTTLEILGLNQNQVKRFVEIKHPEKAREVMSVLRRNPLLMSVCGITFYCMAISTLLSEGVEILDGDIQTYTRLTAFILVSYVSRKLCNYPFVVEVNSYFHKLAFLAYKGIFMHTDNGIPRINFNEYDIAKVGLSPSELDLIRKTGLFQIKDVIMGHRKSISTEFMHLTTQEMLAVAYLLSKSVTSKKILENVFSGGQFNMALLYLFGIQYDKECIWIKDVCEAVSRSDTSTENENHSHISELLKQLCTTSKLGSTDRLKICQLVHESQSEDQAKAVVEYVAPGGVLSISETPMTAIDMLAVTFVCRHSSALRRVALTWVTADVTCMAILSSSLIEPHVSSLKAMSVSSNTMSEHCVETSVNPLNSMKGLQALDVSNNFFGDEGAKTLAAALSTNGSLAILIMENNDIGPDGAAALANALYTNTCLQALDVECNIISDEGAKALAAALSTNGSLITLTMVGNDLGPDGAAALADALYTNTCLQGLDVSHNHIGEEGAKALAGALSTNTCLQGLNVLNNYIGDEGAKALAGALHTNESLITLRLRCNNIGPDGAAALAAALHTNACLQELDIIRNQIGDEGAKALARALRTNESLTTLLLFHNDIGPDGAAALAEALHINKCLQELNIGGNHIGDEGAKVLAGALCTDRSLRTLDISDIGISIDGALALAEALRGNIALKTLYVAKWGLGDEGIKVLQEICDLTGKQLMCF